MEWLWVVVLLAILFAPLLIGVIRAARHPEMGVRDERDESEELRTLRHLEDLRVQRDKRFWR